MAIRNRSEAAKKGWARRRLNDYLRSVRYYLGYTPERVTVWSEDFELLNGRDDRIELIRGPSKPPPAGETQPIHH